MEPRCWPDGAPAPEALPIDRVPALARGAALWRPGDAFSGCYLVRCGALKIVAIEAGGDEQVLQFALPGDLIGLEALARGRHDTMAIALEASALCRVRWPQLAAALDPPLQLLLRASAVLHQRARTSRRIDPLPAIRTFIWAIAQQIGREERSGAETIIGMHLPMSRLEIGQFLGFSEETVCRCLRRLHDQGELVVKGRAVLMPKGPAARARPAAPECSAAR